MSKSLYSQPFGDLDQAASSQQVPKVYKDPTPPSKELIAGMDIDEGHGGTNQTVKAVDDIAKTTSMTSHSSSAPTPADMGIS